MAYYTITHHESYRLSEFKTDVFRFLFIHQRNLWLLCWFVVKLWYFCLLLKQLTSLQRFYKLGNTIPLYETYSFTSMGIPFLSLNHTHLQAQKYHSPLWTILIYSECIYPVPRTSLEGWIIISLLLVCWSWQALSYESLTTFIFFLLNLQPCNLNMTSSCSAIIVSFIHLSQSLYSNR